jgi:hypothetical protein
MTLLLMIRFLLIMKLSNLNYKNKETDKDKNISKATSVKEQAH